MHLPGSVLCLYAPPKPYTSIQSVEDGAWTFFELRFRIAALPEA